MIDYAAIRLQFVKAAQTIIGTDLSQSDGFPNIMFTRSNDVHRDFPYLNIDILDTSKEYGWLTDEFLDDSNNLVQETTYKMLINYHIYDNSIDKGGDALSIAHKLEAGFRNPLVRDEFRSVLGGSIVNTSDPDSRPSLAADRYTESADFTVEFNIHDITSIEDVGRIQNVILEGDLALGPDDPDPLDANVSVITSP